MIWQLKQTRLEGSLVFLTEWRVLRFVSMADLLTRHVSGRSQLDDKMGISDQIFHLCLCWQTVAMQWGGFWIRTTTILDPGPRTQSIGAMGTFGPSTIFLIKIVLLKLPFAQLVKTHMAFCGGI